MNRTRVSGEIASILARSDIDQYLEDNDLGGGTKNMVQRRLIGKIMGANDTLPRFRDDAKETAYKSLEMSLSIDFPGLA